MDLPEGFGRALKVPGIVVSPPDDESEDGRPEKISEAAFRELLDNQRNLQMQVCKLQKISEYWQMKEMKKAYEYQIGELKNAVSEMQNSMTFRLNAIEGLLLKLITKKSSSESNLKDNVATKTSAPPPVAPKSNLANSTGIDSSLSLEVKKESEFSTPVNRRKSGTIIGTEKLQENKSKVTKSSSKPVTAETPKEISKTGSLKVTNEDNRRRSISNLIGLWDKK